MDKNLNRKLMKILVLSGFGLNSENETRRVLESFGGDVVVRHLSDFLESPSSMLAYSAVVIPGGFSFGDNLGAGTALAIILKTAMIDTLQEMRSRGVIFLGICNGCQALIKLGFLSKEGETNSYAITNNAVPIFRCDTQKCKVVVRDSFWFKGLQGTEFDLPIAHGEGRFMVIENSKAHVRPRRSSSKIIGSKIAIQYTGDVNGSVSFAAAIMSEDHNVLAMMPHPERLLSIDSNLKGRAILQNLVIELRRRSSTQGLRHTA